MQIFELLTEAHTKDASSAEPPLQHRPHVLLRQRMPRAFDDGHAPARQFD